MNYPMKLMISGKSIAELAKNARKFLQEIDMTTDVITGQPSTLDSSFPERDALQMSFVDVDKAVENGDKTVRSEHFGDGRPPVHTLVPPSMDFAGTMPPKPMGEVDKRGIPWDARIHSDAKTLTKNGSWRYRRGVEDSVIDQVESELRFKSQQVAPVAPPVPGLASPAQNGLHLNQPTREIDQNRGMYAAPVAPQPVMTRPDFTAPGPAFVPQVEPAPPVMASQPMVSVPGPAIGPSAVVHQAQPAAAPAPLPQQTVSLVHTFETFKKNLIPTLGELVKQGKLTQEYLGILQNHFQVDQIWKVNDEQLNQIFENFVQGGLLQKAV